MDFFDTLTIDASTRRKTADGYLVVTGKIARTGIQHYTGAEVGRPELADVAVYRPEEEVFAQPAMASFAFKPVTDNHPGVGVTADNWRKFSVGVIGGEVVRDGEKISVPFVIQDADTIKKIEDGKVELSAGYGCDLVWGDGETSDGLKFQAKQTNIRANHLAIVDRARGGPELKIGDEAMPDALRKILVDGLQVETTDAGVAAIEKLQRDIADARAKLSTAEAALATANSTNAATIATKDAEIATLKSSVLSDEAKAKLISDGVKELAAVTADALRITKGVASFKIADGMSADQIRAAAVTAKLGEKACQTSDGKPQEKTFFDHAFSILLAQAPAATNDGGSQYQQVVQGGVVTADASQAVQDAIKKENDRIANAWKHQPGEKAA